ncbi:MAG: stage 0 sporulation family protein [Candidatus Kapaibacterium sp.]
MGNPEQHTHEQTSHNHSHHEHEVEPPRNKRKKGPTDNPTDLSEQMVAESLRTRKSNCSHSCGKGDCGSDSGCATGGCGKGSLLELIATNFTYTDERHIVEVTFPGNRKGFAFYEDPEMILRVRDVVVVEHESGQEWAAVSMTGSLVHAKRKAKRLSGEELPVILRLADPTDAKKIEQGKASSRQAYSVCRTRIESFELPMELVDAEWQFDRKKLTFYFTAEGRIDFRALVRDLAAIFNTRIELRQIAVRDAAKRLGGVGICGLELCCTTFLGRYEHITLDHAKIQQIPANPSKLSGQCGRLKCCLLYEIDTYVEGMKRFPPIESTVKTTVGVGSVQKIDLFKEIIWLYHVETSAWESLTLQQYKDFRAGKMPKPEAPPEPVKGGYSASEPQRSSEKVKEKKTSQTQGNASEQSKKKRSDSSTARRSGKKRGAKGEGRVENRGENRDQPQPQAKPASEEKAGRSNKRKKNRKGGE